jgi:hypothetical protein
VCVWVCVCGTFSVGGGCVVGVVVVGHHVAVQGKGVLRDDLHHALPADADADGRRLQRTEDRGEEGASVWGTRSSGGLKWGVG